MHVPFEGSYHHQGGEQQYGHGEDRVDQQMEEERSRQRSGSGLIDDASPHASVNGHGGRTLFS